MTEPPPTPAAGPASGAETASRPRQAQDSLRQTSAAIILLAPFFWATNTILGKAVTDLIPPIGFAFWRWLAAFLIVTPFAWRYLKRDWPLVRRNLPLLALLGATGTAGFNALLYLGLQWTEAINALLINATSPAIIFAATFLLFGDRPRWLEIAGGILSLGGIVLIAARGDLAALATLTLNPGDLAVVVAMILYAIYSALLRKRPAIHPMSFLAVTFFFGATALLPFWGAELAMGRAMPTSGVALAAVFYTAIFPSIVAYFCFNQGVAKLGANRAGLSLQLIPLFGAGLAIVFLGEAFSAYHAIGTGLILGGLLLAHARRRKPGA